MRDSDVVIAGAGPAGCAAAITLARAGRRVLVVDRAAFPRDKCCGDGLTTLALRRLEHLGLDPGAVEGWREVSETGVRSPSGRTVGLPLPHGIGVFSAVAPRASLDAALVALARTAGAEVWDAAEAAVTGVTPGPEAVRITLAGGDDLRARYLVAADGMWSPVRRLLGAGEPGYLGEWHALRQYVDGVTGSAADVQWVWFEPDLLPGYAWSFPVGEGAANVGLCVVRRPGVPTGELGRTFERLLDRPHVAEALGPSAARRGRVTAWPIPARIDRAVLARGRVLFAGDAAGAADPLTGEGIGQAVRTGELAAEAILAAGAEQPEAAAACYRHAVRHELVADHRMAAALQHVLARPLGAQCAVAAAGLSPWTRERFGRWLFEDEPRAVVVTPARWHRRFLARPGAYPSARPAAHASPPRNSAETPAP